jgi:hypothetical protein
MDKEVRFLSFEGGRCRSALRENEKAQTPYWRLLSELRPTEGECRQWEDPETVWFPGGKRFPLVRRAVRHCRDCRDVTTVGSDAGIQYKS